MLLLIRQIIVFVTVSTIVVPTTLVSAFTLNDLSDWESMMFLRLLS